ncbi:hypothetical protein CLIB1423_04S00826 [[Candida] railenensis]|uniref:Uncharacterized protein n=1 Tax=[Candida] railenensis TaxID=45579 RepID=A0A9P0VX20_9ASCO|nr:hypothetical protein CLIB1423_04S00826 [[Candida] railenensis]
MAQNYTAVHGLMQLLYACNNQPAEGTGIQILVDQAHNLLGTQIPKVMIDYTNDVQINLFGDYPAEKDVIPSAIFAAVFGLFMFAHLFVFLVNLSRGHHFWLSFAWIFYNFMKVIGWIFRVIWAKDITKVRIGISGSVFLIMSTIILVSFNLILAQRIFTWRHPVGGSRKLFWNTMFVFYGFVAGIVIMTILASAVPYLYFLSDRVFKQWVTCVKASSILIVLYCLTSLSLIGLAYMFKPTRKDENLYTYQPWWIKSFSPTYYVEHGAAERAAETFMKRTSNHRHAVRVIAATHHHHNMVEGLTNERGDLKHNGSLAILTLTTIFILVGAIGRSIAVFQAKPRYAQSQVCNPIFMYICWGFLEAMVNVLYLVGRVDLRFYRPDRLPKKVRAIITAQQSVDVSDIEDSDDEYIGSSDSETNVNYGTPEKPGLHDDDDSEFRF